MKKITLSALVLISAYQVGFAQSFNSTGGWGCEHYTTGNQTYIISSNGSEQQVNVPSSVYDPSNFSTYTVTQLGDNTYPVFPAGAPSAITTPSTLQSINSYSCAYLTYLNIVNINGSPTIEPNAFLDDPNLQTVTGISNDIGDSAFENCHKLRNVELKDGVTKIGKRAFANCRSLRSLTIPRTVVSIAPDAFVGSALKTVTLLRGQLATYPLLPKGSYIRVQEMNW